MWHFLARWDKRQQDLWNQCPPKVWIAVEIALKKAYLKPEHLPQGQIPKLGFGMGPFPGQLRLVRTAIRLWFKIKCFGGRCGVMTWNILLKFKLVLGTETSTLDLEGPSSVPATELLTVALRSFLEQIKKEFTFHFWNCKNDNIRLNSLKAPAHQRWWSPQLSCLQVLVGDLELVQGQSWHCAAWPSWKEYGWEEESRHIGSWWQGPALGLIPEEEQHLASGGSWYGPQRPSSCTY